MCQRHAELVLAVQTQQCITWQTEHVLVNSSCMQLLTVGTCSSSKFTLNLNGAPGQELEVHPTYAPGEPQNCYPTGPGSGRHGKGVSECVTTF